MTILLTRRGLLSRAVRAGLDDERWLDRPGDRAHVLLRRATYGPTDVEMARMDDLGPDAWLDEQLDPERLDLSGVEARLAPLPALAMSPEELAEASRDDDKAAAVLGAQLKVAALARHVHSPAQLHERMVELWSDHLNVPQAGPGLSLLKLVEDREVIRPHALGRFADLLVASAKSPAMLAYLDNARSFRDAINENYARELLELHTVGVDGGYDEDDVVAVARLLTGMTIDRRTYGFRFVSARHDRAPASILGWDRPSTGDPMGHIESFLVHLARLPSTARHVARKIAVRFVSDTPSEDLLETMTVAYLDADTAVVPVLRAMFDHPDFERSAGSKFQRPWDHLMTAVRALRLEVRTDLFAALAGGRPGRRAGVRELIDALQTLGQVPFAWPAPNGYPDVAAAWLDGGALLTRWNLVGDLAVGTSPLLQPGEAGTPFDDVDAATPEQAATTLVERLHHGSLTAHGRRQVRDAFGADRLPTDPDARRAALAALAALLLSIPDAQHR